MDCESDRFCSEIGYERLALGGTVGVVVELDARLAGIDFLGDYTAFGEHLGNFFDCCVGRKIGDVDGGVFGGWTGLFVFVLWDLR